MYSSSEKLICAAASVSLSLSHPPHHTFTLPSPHSPQNTLPTSEVDISEKIRRRVAKGYGFSPSTNVKLLKGDPVLQEVWAWLQCILTTPTMLVLVL